MVEGTDPTRKKKKIWVGEFEKGKKILLIFKRHVNNSSTRSKSSDSFFRVVSALTGMENGHV